MEAVQYYKHTYTRPGARSYTQSKHTHIQQIYMWNSTNWDYTQTQHKHTYIHSQFTIHWKYHCKTTCKSNDFSCAVSIGLPVLFWWSTYIHFFKESGAHTLRHTHTSYIWTEYGRKMWKEREVPIRTRKISLHTNSHAFTYIRT